MRSMLFPALVLSLLLPACGGGSSPEEEQTSNAVEEEVAMPGGQELPGPGYEDPGSLAEAILEHYYGAFDELAALVSGNPPAAGLKPLVAELRDRYIDLFVGLGVYYEAMDAPARARVDSRVSAGVAAVDMEDFNAVSQADVHYRAEDPELADKIRDFNIITQYAFYDLLRQQEPEEAARLGI